jgi:hypothetical protein
MSRVWNLRGGLRPKANIFQKQGRFSSSSTSDCEERRLGPVPDPQSSRLLPTGISHLKTENRWLEGFIGPFDQITELTGLDLLSTLPRICAKGGAT